MSVEVSDVIGKHIAEGRECTWIKMCSLYSKMIACMLHCLNSAILIMSKVLWPHAAIAENFFEQEQFYLYSGHSNLWWNLPSVVNPSCLHATRASSLLQCSSQTVPHVSFKQTSTRPSPWLLWFPFNRRLPSSQNTKEKIWKMCSVLVSNSLDFCLAWKSHSFPYQAFTVGI